MDIGLRASLALILLGSVLQGTFAVPMKFAPRWRHENIWLVFTFSGLVVFPWLLAIWTVPRVWRGTGFAGF